MSNNNNKKSKLQSIWHRNLSFLTWKSIEDNYAKYNAKLTNVNREPYSNKSHLIMEFFLQVFSDALFKENTAQDCFSVCLDYKGKRNH